MNVKRFYQRKTKNDCNDSGCHGNCSNDPPLNHKLSPIKGGETMDVKKMYMRKTKSECNSGNGCSSSGNCSATP